MTGARFRLRHALLGGLAAALLSVPAAASTEDGVDSLSGAYLAARVADAGKDIEGAAEYYRAAHAIDPKNLYLLERALTLTAAAGDFDKAVEFARALLKEAPDSRPARLILAVADIRDKRYAGAIAHMREAGSGVLAGLTRTLVNAWALAGQGEVDKALAELDTLRGESWYEPFKLMHGGYIAAAGGRSADALSRFRRAYDLDKNAVRTMEAFARATAQSGDRAGAARIVEDYLTRFPGNPLAQAALSDIKGAGVVETAVRTPAEGVAEALSGLGAAIGQEGGFELAALYLRLALALEPQSAGGLAALSLGNLLDSNGQGAQAIEVFQGIGQDQPYRSLGQLRAAIALDRLDRVEEAERAFKDSIARDPTDLQARIAYGNMLRGRERFKEAADLYSEVIARTPNPTRNDWTVFYFRGIAYERTDRWPLAEADFRRALELHPDQPLVLNYLGYSWVDKGLNLQEALTMIQKAVDLRPDDGYIVDSLGWAYYKLGRYDEAVTELERAVSLRPDDPVLNDHLGDAYWKVGRKLEAQFQWRHARDLGAKPPELDVINRKIAARSLDEALEAKPEEDPRQIAAAGEKVYVVKGGESLYDVAAEVYGDGLEYKRLLEANREMLRDSNELKPGMQLKVPAPADL